MHFLCGCPRQDSNLRHRLRRAEPRAGRRPGVGGPPTALTPPHGGRERERTYVVVPDSVLVKAEDLNRCGAAALCCPRLASSCRTTSARSGSSWPWSWTPLSLPGRLAGKRSAAPGAYRTRWRRSPTGTTALSGPEQPDADAHSGYPADLAAQRFARRDCDLGSGGLDEGVTWQATGGRGRT